MKRLAVIWLIGMLIFHRSYAQSEDTGYHHWSLGISAGDILHELFNGENTNPGYPAFLLEYSGHRYALQVGFRPDYNRADTDHAGFLDTEISDRLSFSGNLTLSRSIFAESRWDIRAGLRYEGGWSREDDIDDSGFDRVTTRRLQWNTGGGPVIDIRFFVHPRISFGTDAGIVYSYGHSELQQLFTNFPDFNNTKETIIEKRLRISEPMSIYMRFLL